MRRQSGRSNSLNTNAKRLWSRSGLRLLSVGVLVLALVGGGYVTMDRHHQQAAAAANARAAQQMKLAQLREAAYLAATPQLNARATAQQSANSAASAAASSAAATAKKAEDTARAAAGTSSTSRSTTRTTTPNFGPIPTSCKAYTGNKAIGCAIVVQKGLGLEQMVCLDKMWTHESGWRTTAENSHSGSYGIPQALPASRMGKASEDGASDYRTNPATQIRWGIWYTTSRYGSPCQAWTFWQAHSWY